MGFLEKIASLGFVNQKVYDRGFNDAIEGNPRQILSSSQHSETMRKWKILYDSGYDDGLKERKLRGFGF